MIVIIQTLLIIAVLLFAARMLALRNTYKGGAVKKLGLFALAVVMIFSIINPGVTTAAANMIGVGRGADLLLYVLFIAFLLYIVSQYIKSQDQRDSLYRLARRVALDEAGRRYHKLLSK